MSTPFRDASVMIVGAAGGLGSAMARAFAAAGARLTLVDRDDPALMTLAKSLEREFSPPAPVLTVEGDASDALTAEVAMGIASSHGPLKVLCNNAAIDPLSATTVTATSEQAWDAIMAVNLRSAFLFTRAAIPIMAAGGGGAIVNTASIGGIRPLRHEAAYAVSKAALVQLTRCVALDHAAEGIRCNCICPGLLESAMGDRLAEMSPEMLEGRAAHALRAVPAGRAGRYQEIAEAVLFLADPERAGYITGAALVMDGGLTLT